MNDQVKRPWIAWIDVLWLAFLFGLALLRPLTLVSKQVTLLAIGAFQIVEHHLPLFSRARRGPHLSVALKLALALLLIYVTGGIESSYYLIVYVPVVSAAMLFGIAGTLAWTAISSSAYLAFLPIALRYYDLSPEGARELAIRILFFFLAAILVNRFVAENKAQAERYRRLAEELTATNRELERVQAEARRSERLAALGQLSAGLAHELRNPLGVIKGSAETLGQRLVSAGPLEKELCDYISGEVNRLNAIVSRFLEFARPSQLQMQREEVEGIVERALETVQAQKKQSNIELVRNYGKGLPPVMLDPDLCEKVFTNLAQNAIEAMPDGGRLTVTTSRTSLDGRDGIEIVVEDTGVGIAPEHVEQIFNPFFSTKSDGVGLGLSIVSKIIDDHRGRIRVQSQPGGGSRFTVFLPLAANPAERDGEPPGD
jgi:signal transduction histidine kinase